MSRAVSSGSGPRSEAPGFCGARVKRHSCGCHTVWDAAHWRSVALSRCDVHAPLDPAGTARSALRRVEALCDAHAADDAIPVADLRATLAGFS